MGNCLCCGTHSAQSPSHSVAIPLITPSQEIILQSSNKEIFTFSKLQDGTNNFCNDNLLGRGGFGCVYKGLIDGNEVAVKKLELVAKVDNKEWATEIKYLAMLQHENIVRLIGYCREDPYRMLVYEYMPNGSSDRHLFEGGLGLQLLSWNLRMKIALGVANGLAYMHNEADRNPIVHLDVKCANVLLDSDYNAKLADFGLAVDSPAGVCGTMKGTRGYVDIVSLNREHIDTMYDVYSFGALLFEMLTGQKMWDQNRPENNLRKWVEPYFKKKGEMIHIFDHRLGNEYPLILAKKLTSLANQCVCKPEARPTMAELVGVFELLQA